MTENKPKMRMWLWTLTYFGNKTIFYRDATITQAIEWLVLLADYNLVLDASIVANASGLEVFENNEWSEWYSEDSLDIWDYIKSLNGV